MIIVSGSTLLLYRHERRSPIFLGMHMKAKLKMPESLDECKSLRFAAEKDAFCEYLINNREDLPLESVQLNGMKLSTGCQPSPCFGAKSQGKVREFD